MSEFDNSTKSSCELKPAADTGVSSSELLCMTVWIQAAAKLPGKSLHVGIVLWLSTKHVQENEIELGNLHTLSFGVDRNSKYRALRWLESEKLVAVKRRAGFSPLVKILPAGDDR